MASVLVTGGAGFIGSHIAELLIEQGYEVFIIDNLSKECSVNIPHPAIFWKCDIRSPEVENIFQQYAFDYVIHLAAQTAVSVSNVNPIEDQDTNIAGLLKILDLSRIYQVKRFIFSSSAATYGNPSRVPISEDLQQRPISFYGLSKMVGEKYIQMYHDIYGLEYVILRYSNVYGPRQDSSLEGGVISIFIECVKKAIPYTIYGDGKQTRDFIYVKDIAEANIAAMQTSYGNRIYNISTNIQMSLNDIIEELGRITGKRNPVHYLPPKPGDIYHSQLDNGQAKKYLHWQPAYDLHHGLTSFLMPL